MRKWGWSRLMNSLIIVWDGIAPPVWTHFKRIYDIINKAFFQPISFMRGGQTRQLSTLKNKINEPSLWSIGAPRQPRGKLSDGRQQKDTRNWVTAALVEPSNGRVVFFSSCSPRSPLFYTTQEGGPFWIIQHLLRKEAKKRRGRSTLLITAFHYLY